MRTASNLACRVLRPGTGTRHAQPEDVVEIRWSAWTTDGRAIGASADAQAEALPMRRLLPGLREAVALMTEGESARFWLPKELAYGDGVGGRPAGTLVFDVELVKIQ